MGVHPDQATLRLRRGRTDSAMLRKVVVEVDGSVVARLSQGADVALRVTAGPHVVRARMDWASSPPVEVVVEPPGEAVVDVAIPFSSVWRSFLTPRRALTVTVVSPPAARGPAARA